MTPLIWCEYIVATAFGLSGAVFIVACVAALIKWLFIKPEPEWPITFGNDDTRPGDFRPRSKVIEKDSN